MSNKMERGRMGHASAAVLDKGALIAALPFGIALGAPIATTTPAPPFGIARGGSSSRVPAKMGSTICPTSEIVCLPVLIFTYSHVENALFFALDLVVFCNSNYFFKHTNWYTLTNTTFSNIPIGIV
jgi:hypothetical protein